PVRPIQSAERSTAKEWVAPARFSGKRERADGHRGLVIVLERNVKEERAHSKPAARLPSAPHQRELPAAARKSELPLSRFPLRGKAGRASSPTKLARCVPANGAGTNQCRGSPRKGVQSASLNPPCASADWYPSSRVAS